VEEIPRILFLIASQSALLFIITVDATILHFVMICEHKKNYFESHNHNNKKNKRDTVFKKYLTFTVIKKELVVERFLRWVLEVVASVLNEDRQ
jgi:hypothetical protein